MAEQHNTSTGHAPAGEHKGAFPPFQSETYASQLVWLVLAFVLLFVLMSKWALPRVGNILDARQKRIDGDIAEAGALKAQSDEAVAAYEKAIANETRDKQAAAAEARRKTLEDDLNAKLAEAEKTIAATKTAAMSNVRGIAEDATRAIVERLIGTAPSDKAVADAVADALKR